MTFFETHNLPLAAFIVVNQKLRLDHIELDARGIAHFVFADPGNEGLQLETQFLTNAAIVDPNAFYRAVRTLRGMLENQKKQTPRNENNRYVHASYK